VIKPPAAIAAPVKRAQSNPAAAQRDPLDRAPPPLRLAGQWSEGLDDADLVLRAQAGDRSAFEQLVRGTARMLYARLYLDTSDRERTEDLVQETYLTAWRSIGQLRDVPDASSFRRWLFAVARTVRIDSARHDLRKKRAGPRPAGQSEAQDDLIAAIHDPSLSPDESMERREKQDQALALLRSLPEEYRAPIAMRYLAGADYQVICRQLGLSNGSLRGLLNRGMARLRQLLGASEE
jgi:RNA polymerase sigma-70 factor (ECF subfamily)